MKDTEHQLKTPSNINKYSSNNNQNKPFIQKPITTIYSLKPLRLTVPKDISALSIFQSMKKDINYIYPKSSLNNHLTYISSKNRTNMISKMRSFIIKYKLSSYSFFLAIYYMDLILSRGATLSLDKIALGSLILSVKFHEIDGRAPSISKYKDFNSNFLYFKEDIMKIEIECLKKLGYELVYSHPFHFIQLFKLNGIVFNTDIIINNAINSSVYSLPAEILECIIEENSNYINKNPFLLACACVSISREMYKIDKWNIILEKVFCVGSPSFEDEYEYAKEIYQRKVKLSVNNQTSSNISNTFKAPERNNESSQKSHIISQIIPSPNNMKDVNKKAVRDIIASADKQFARRYLRNYKAKSLELNLAQLGEIIKSRKETKKENFCPLRELNDSSTAEDSSSFKNFTNEVLTQSASHLKIQEFKNSAINIFDNCIKNSSDYLRSKYISSYKEQKRKIDIREYATADNCGGEKDVDDEHKEIGNYSRQMISFQGNYENINKEYWKSESLKNVCLTKRSPCISFKTPSLSNSNSVGCYTIKDLAKQKSMKKGFNYPIQFSMKSNK